MKIKRKIGSFDKAAIMQMFQDFLDELDQGAIAIIENFRQDENPEFMYVELDSEEHILGFTRKDGSHYAYNLSSETIDALAERISALEDAPGNENFENNEDVEGRLEITKDADDKIVSYRKPDGTLVENAGIETTTFNSTKVTANTLEVGHLELAEGAKEDIIDVLPDSAGLYQSPCLPKYGVTNIKTETFYLTAIPGLNSISQTELRQDFEDTNANATDRMTLWHYYYGNVRLRHYAAGKVKRNASDNKFYAKETVRKVGNTWYYADTLGYNGTSRTKVIEGYTEPYNGATPSSGNYALIETEVIQVTAPCRVGTWTVEDWDFNAVEGTDIGKKYEHNCVADIDFGHYLTKTDTAVGVKHQGNSTQGYRKRNYRYTFYKDGTFAKKDKVKIGEMLRLSKFNLKASMVDPSRIKELILYRIISKIWHSRPITDRYDWDSKTSGFYHGASGNIHGFPVRLEVNGEFYGIYTFALPKDGKNYMLDDEDEGTGLFVSGSHNTANDWGITLPYRIKDHYDSEMDSDDLDDYPGIVEALTNWTHFINGRLYKGSDDNEYNSTELTDIDGTKYVTSTLEDGQVVAGSISAELIPFDRKNIAERLDVLGFIDYMILMQVFVMYDNQHNNMLMYSGAEKKKMFPFFYDLDGSINENRDGGSHCDIFADGVSLSSDMSLWKNLRDEYWDDMVNRYCELRKTYLSPDYIRTVYKDIVKHVPSTDFTEEQTKWGSSTSVTSFDGKMVFLEERIKWLDENYFKV